MWLCVQSFESGNWLMPSPRELRTQVYTGIVHGATGIMYFAMDSYVTRAGEKAYLHYMSLCTNGLRHQFDVA